MATRYTPSRIAVELFFGAAGVALLTWAIHADIGWFERHVLVSFCVTRHDEPAKIAVARLAGAGLGLLLLFIVRPWLGRRAASLRWVDFAIWIGSLLLALVAACAVTEIWLRGHEGAVSIEVQKRDEPRFRRDDRLSWRYEPNQTKQISHYGRVVTYAIDAHGNRAARQDEVVDPSKPTVVIAGESTTFGLNLPYEDTMQAMLERDTGMQVINLSAPGYGNDQAYLRLMDELSNLKKPVAVVFPVVNLQVTRNAILTQPHFEPQDGGSIQMEPAATGLAALRILDFVRFEPYHGDWPLRMTAAIVSAANRAIRDAGARPIFLVMNYGDPCLGESTLVVDILEEQGLPFVRIDLQPGDWLSDADRHPARRGMQKMADAVERALAR